MYEMLMEIPGIGWIVATHPCISQYEHPEHGTIPYRCVEIKLVKNDGTEKPIADIDYETLYGLTVIPYSDEGQYDVEDYIHYANTATFKKEEQ